MMFSVSKLLVNLVRGRPGGLRSRLWRRERTVHHPGRPNGEPPRPLGEGLHLPDGFQAVLRQDALGPGEMTEVSVGGHVVALCNVEGRFHAVSNVCPHAGGPIGDGTIEAHTVTCPYHGWSFDVRDGRCFVNPEAHLPTYPVQVIDGVVCVKA